MRLPATRRTIWSHLRAPVSGNGQIISQPHAEIGNGKNEMPREAQESRRSYILQHAERLAESGDFSTCHAIEVALRRQGFIEAFEVLQRSGQRKRLSGLCTLLRESGNAWPHPGISARLALIQIRPAQ